MFPLSLFIAVFLLDEDLTYDTQKIKPEQAVQQAEALICPDCPHTGKCAHPAFPSTTDREAAKQLRPIMAIAKPFVPARGRNAAVQLQLHQGLCNKACAASRLTSATTASKPAAPAAAVHGTAGASADTSAIASSTCTADNSTNPDAGWCVVKGKNKSRNDGKLAHKSGVKATLAYSSNPSPVASGAGSFSVLGTSFALKLADRTTHSHVTGEQQPMQEQQSEQQQQQQQVQKAPLGKSAKKNLARKLRRQAAGDKSAPSSRPAPSATPAAPAMPSSVAVASSDATSSPYNITNGNQASTASKVPSTPSSADNDDGWCDAPCKGAKRVKVDNASGTSQQHVQDLRALLERKHQHLIQQVKEEWQLAVTAAAESSATRHYTSCHDHYVNELAEYDMASVEVHDCGPFTAVPRDVMLGLLCLLKVRDVASLALTCKGLRTVCEDGAVWQSLLGSHYPAHEVRLSLLFYCLIVVIVVHVKCMQCSGIKPGRCTCNPCASTTNVRPRLQSSICCTNTSILPR